MISSISFSRCSQTKEKMSGIPYSLSLSLESHFRQYEPCCVVCGGSTRLPVHSSRVRIRKREKILRKKKNNNLEAEGGQSQTLPSGNKQTRPEFSRDFVSCFFLWFAWRLCTQAGTKFIHSFFCNQIFLFQIVKKITIRYPYFCCGGFASVHACASRVAQAGPIRSFPSPFSRGHVMTSCDLISCGRRGQMR